MIGKAKLMPLSLERVCEHLDSNSQRLFGTKDTPFTVLSPGQAISLNFQGVDLRIFSSPMGIHLMGMGVSEHLSSARYPQLLAWVEHQRGTKPQPVLVAIDDKENDLATLHYHATIPGAWPYTNGQVADALEGLLILMADIGHAFYRDFDAGGASTVP